MSNEVKRFSPEYCEAGGVGWAEMQEDAEGAWCKASDYDALAAELAAIRAAGGEDASPDITTKHGYPAYSVAQHQRIVAAMAAELERAKEEVTRWHTLACNHSRAEDRLRAELEAARKQSPIGHVALGSHTGVVFYSHMPQLPDGTKLYALPPLAGQVSVPRELLQAIEQSWRVPNGWPKSVPDHAAEKIESGLRELRALLATPSMEVDV